MKENSYIMKRGIKNGGTYIVSFIVSKLLARKVNKIDMVTSLKGNE